jgi:hypothetical protein
MGHLMSSTENIPGYDEIERVGVGLNVLYHTRIGNQRQGRNTFPAFVLSQHPDDGTLDLLVFFEPEDILWERRVPRWTEEQPGRCWEPVKDAPASPSENALANEITRLSGMCSMLMGRVVALETKIGYGRPPTSEINYDTTITPEPLEDRPGALQDEEPRQKRKYTRRAQPESAGEVEEGE